MGTNKALQNLGLKNEDDIITYKTQKSCINIAIVKFQTKLERLQDKIVLRIKNKKKKT